MEVKNQNLFEDSHNQILKTEPRTQTISKRKCSSEKISPIHKSRSGYASSDDERVKKEDDIVNKQSLDDSAKKVRYQKSRSRSGSPLVSTDIATPQKFSEQEATDKKIFALRHVIQKDSKAADLTWSLFCAACHSYRFDSSLKPFPPFYVKADEKDIDSLRTVAESAPAIMLFYSHLQDMENKFSSKLIELFHWVLVQTREPKLHYVPKEDHASILSLVPFKAKTLLPSHIFKVAYNSKSSLEVKFQEMAKKYKTKFAFHGSRLDNFHSIIHHGLQVSLNKVGAFGPGIYLSSELSVCLPYSCTGFSWGKSMFGSEMSIVALCEMIDHHDVKCQSEKGIKSSRSYAAGSENGPVPNKYFIVQNSDLVRVRYLLVYCTDKAPEVEESHRSVIAWIKEHKLVSAFIGYILFLLSMGVRNSPVVQRYYRYFLERLG